MSDSENEEDAWAAFHQLHQQLNLIGQQGSPPQLATPPPAPPGSPAEEVNPVGWEPGEELVPIAANVIMMNGQLVNIGDNFFLDGDDDWEHWHEASDYWSVADPDDDVWQPQPGHSNLVVRAPSGTPTDSSGELGESYTFGSTHSGSPDLLMDLLFAQHLQENNIWAKDAPPGQVVIEQGIDAMQLEIALNMVVQEINENAIGNFPNMPPGH